MWAKSKSINEIEFVAIDKDVRATIINNYVKTFEKRSLIND